MSHALSSHAVTITWRVVATVWCLSASLLHLSLIGADPQGQWMRVMPPYDPRHRGAFFAARVLAATLWISFIFLIW